MLSARDRADGSPPREHLRDQAARAHGRVALHGTLDRLLVALEDQDPAQIAGAIDAAREHQLPAGPQLLGVTLVAFDELDHARAGAGVVLGATPQEHERERGHGIRRTRGGASAVVVAQARGREPVEHVTHQPLTRDRGIAGHERVEVVAAGAEHEHPTQLTTILERPRREQRTVRRHATDVRHVAGLDAVGVRVALGRPARTAPQQAEAIAHTVGRRRIECGSADQREQQEDRGIPKSHVPSGG